MTYDKQYYDEKKLEIQKEYGSLVNEIYTEIERLVVKKMQKQQDMIKKLQEIENREKASLITGSDSNTDMSPQKPKVKVKRISE